MLIFSSFNPNFHSLLIKNLCITECPKKGVSILRRRRRRRNVEAVFSTGLIRKKVKKKGYRKDPTHLVQ